MRSVAKVWPVVVEFNLFFSHFVSFFRSVKNNLNPDWTTSFIFDYSMGTPCKIAINVFDEVRKGNNISMGSAVFDVAEVLGARGNTKAKKLKKGGT